MYDEACADLARSFLTDRHDKKWNEQTVTTIAQAVQDTIEDAINDLDDEDEDEDDLEDEDEDKEPA